MLIQIQSGMSNGPINDPIGAKSKLGWLAKWKKVAKSDEFSLVIAAKNG